RDLVKTHPVWNMTDITRILQSVQVTYQLVTEKEKAKGVWLKSINNKILTINASIELLARYKDDSNHLKGEDLRAARRLMRTYGLILDKPKDRETVISHLKERTVIYSDKIRKHEKRKAFRKENDKFELYRGRFYRDLSSEEALEHNVFLEEIKDTWSKMWEEDDCPNSHLKLNEYVLNHTPGEKEETCFPKKIEFCEIIKWLPNWKAAGPDGVFNFFIKSISSLHPEIYKVIRNICLASDAQDKWFYKGITHLIPKGTPKSGKDFRPFTCMSNLYKLTTKCATSIIQLIV
ncbi:MAG: hypothetical protein ACRC28_18320, partial [Clostridium sp.]|uniref:hypothetical protein n=1 Tax=Clostridium sp. TaxID=1506 RepID=UPI003F383FA5